MNNEFGPGKAFLIMATMFSIALYMVNDKVELLRSMPILLTCSLVVGLVLILTGITALIWAIIFNGIDTMRSWFRKEDMEEEK